MQTKRSWRAWPMAAAALTAACLLTTPAWAGDTYWTLDPATPGQFDIPANWNNGVPSNSSNYQVGYIDNGGTVLLDIALTFNLEGLTLDGGSTLDQSAGTLANAPFGVQVITGLYTLEGTGVLNTGVKVGAPLAGDGSVVSEFDMSAGSVNSISVGVLNGVGGKVHLTGGTVTNALGVGTGGTGYVIQDGGTVAGVVQLGEVNRGGGAGHYTLHSGAISGSQLALFGPTATFDQTGGSVSVTTYIADDSGAQYTLSGGSFSAQTFTESNRDTSLDNPAFTYTGGTMSISKTAVVAGTLDFGGAATTLELGAGGYFDFSNANLANISQATVSAGADSLVIFAAGFDPQTALASYNNAGWTHILGTTFVIPAGQAFTPPQQLLINSAAPYANFPDPIDVYGTFAAPPGRGLNVQHGLTVRAGARVDLGTGGLFAETADSYRFEGGTFTATRIEAGSVYGQGTTPAIVTQAGGTVSTSILTVSGGHYLLQAGQLNVTTGTLPDYSNAVIVQTGGDAYFEHLTAGYGTSYTLGGGTVTIGTDMKFYDPYNQGKVTLDFADGSGTLKILNDATVDLSTASILNSLNATILVGQGATIDFPVGFDPLTAFASYQTDLSLPPQPPTLYVTAGQTLEIATENTHLDVAGTVVGTPGITAVINQGVLIHDGGSVNINGGVTVPDASSGIASGTINAWHLDVGVAGAGLFTQSGGTATIGGGMYVYQGGEYLMSGGTLNNQGYLDIGESDSVGTFVQSGGVNTVAGTIELSQGLARNPNTYELSGTGELDAGPLLIQDNGSFVQTGGTANFGSNGVTSGIILNSSDSRYPVSYQISAGTLNAPALSIGQYSAFTQSGGSVTISGTLSVAAGYAIDQGGAYDISGGTLHAGTLSLGIGGSGTPTDPHNALFNVSGGQVDIDWLRLYPDNQFNWTGGDVHFYSFQFASPDLPVTWDLGNQTRTITFDNAFIDLRGPGSFINAQNVDMVFGPNTLVLLPSTFDPSVFHSFTNNGVTATDTNTLTIPAGTTMTMGGHIEPYVPAQSISLAVQGQLLGYTDPAKPPLTLTARLSILAGGSVNLGMVHAYEVINGIDETIGDLNTSRVNLNAGSLIDGDLTATYVYFDGAAQHAGTVTCSLFWDGPSGGYSLDGTGAVQSDFSVSLVGTFNQSGGSHTTKHLWVDSNYKLSGGTLHVSDATIGMFDDDALMTVSGGSFTADAQLVLGQNSQAVGTLTITNGSIQTPTLVLGNQGKGILNANGGSIQITGTGDALILGNAANSFDPVTALTIKGASISVPNGTTQIALAEKATFNLQSGTFSSQSMVLGENAAATASQTGGTLNVAQTLYVGPSTGLHSPGETPDSLTISGGTLNAGALAIGQNGPGQMTINGSTAAVNVSGSVVVGTDGALALSAGSLTAASLDTSGTPANFNWTGGTLTITGTGGLALSGNGPLGAALSLAGGRTLIVSHAFTIDGGASFNAAGGTLQVGSLVVHGALAGGFTAQTLTTAPDTSLSLTLGTPLQKTLEPHITPAVTKSALLRPAATTTTPGDVITVTADGGLNLNGGSIQFTSGTGAASLGYYPIIQYTGTFSGSLANIVLPPEADGVIYQLDATHDPGFIDVHRGFLGDANDDGIVNAIDLGILATNYNATGTDWARGDYNGDGTVNTMDLGILASNYNAIIDDTAPPTAPDTLPQLEAANPGTSPVPEPASLALLTAGTLLLLSRRRRPVQINPNCTPQQQPQP